MSVKLEASQATSDVDTGQLEHPLGGRFEDRFEFRFGEGKMLAATGQRVLLGAVGEKAVMANPHESVGKHMLEKSPDEFIGWQDRDFATIAVGPIAPVETQATALSREEAMV